MLEPGLLTFAHARQAVPLLGAVVAAMVLARVLRRPHTEIYKRGVLVRDAVPRRCRAAGSGGSFGARVALAGVWVPPEDELKHFKIIGSTGTGKSTAIRELLAAALERGDRAIIADPDGGYQARLYRRYRGDMLLNPFEADSARWDPYAEIADPYDIEHLSSALIPSSHDASAAEWRSYARTFLSAVLRVAHSRRDCAELWRLLSAASADELKPLVAGTPAQPFLESENARMFGSIPGSEVRLREGRCSFRTRPRTSPRSAR